MKKKLNKARKWLIGIMLAATAFDVITFLLSPREFEVNPLYLLTGTVLIPLALKFIIVGLVWYKVAHYGKSHTSNFFYTLVAVYLIVLQLLGGVSNVAVTAQYEATKGTPEEILPLPRAEAFNIMTIIMGIMLYLPILFAIAAFKIWIWSTLTCRKNDKL